MSAETLDWQKQNGLLPAIIQHASTGQVLMLGWMSPESLTRTLETGHVTFFSRSRNRLWVKGETSGHVLRLIRIDTDCDRDTLLIQAEPEGPTCHLGSTSCFGPAEPAGAGLLPALAAVIKARRDADPEKSYTTRLLQGPLHRIAQKVGEEGVETALAAVADPKSLAGEASDLLYHLLVLLEASGVSLEQVLAVLAGRAPSAGADEVERRIWPRG